MPETSESAFPGRHSPAQDDVPEAVVKLLNAASRALDRDGLAAGSRVARAVAEPIRRGLAPWQVRKVQDHVEKHLDQQIWVDDLASVTRLSPSYFAEAFRRTFGLAPHAYLIRCRIERAQMLMLTTAEPLSQIAVACGFYDQAHLSRTFRRATSASPTAWRRLHSERRVMALAA